MPCLVLVYFFTTNTVELLWPSLCLGRRLFAHGETFYSPTRSSDLSTSMFKANVPVFLFPCVWHRSTCFGRGVNAIPLGNVMMSTFCLMVVVSFRGRFCHSQLSIGFFFPIVAFFSYYVFLTSYLFFFFTANSLVRWLIYFVFARVLVAVGIGPTTIGLTT